MTFQGGLRVALDPGNAPGWDSWFVPGPYNNNSRIPETEKRVHRIHGPLETGLQKDASQLGGPLKGAGGF